MLNSTVGSDKATSYLKIRPVTQPDHSTPTTVITLQLLMLPH